MPNPCPIHSPSQEVLAATEFLSSLVMSRTGISSESPQAPEEARGGVEREEIVGGCMARNAKTGYMEVRMFLLFATKELRDFYIDQMHQRRFGRDFPRMHAPDLRQGGTVVVPNLQVDEEGMFELGIIDLKKPRPSWLWMTGLRDCYGIDVERMHLARNVCGFCGERGHHERELMMVDGAEEYRCPFVAMTMCYDHQYQCQVCGRDNHWWTKCMDQRKKRIFEDMTGAAPYIKELTNISGTKIGIWIPFDYWMFNTDGNRRDYNLK